MYAVSAESRVAGTGVGAKSVATASMSITSVCSIRAFIDIYRISLTHHVKEEMYAYPTNALLDIKLEQVSLAAPTHRKY